MTHVFKMGSDKSHFNVLLIVRDKVTRQCLHTNHNLSEEKGQPKRNQTEVLFTSLTPYRLAKPLRLILSVDFFCIYARGRGGGRGQTDNSSLVRGKIMLIYYCIVPIETGGGGGGLFLDG